MNHSLPTWLVFGLCTTLVAVALFQTIQLDEPSPPLEQTLTVTTPTVVTVTPVEPPPLPTPPPVATIWGRWRLSDVRTGPNQPPFPLGALSGLRLELILTTESFGFEVQSGTGQPQVSTVPVRFAETADHRWSPVMTPGAPQQVGLAGMANDPFYFQLVGERLEMVTGATAENPTTLIFERVAP